MTSWIITILDHLRTQEMCNDAVHMKPLSLTYIPDRFKTQEMCNEAVRNKPRLMLFVPDHFKTMEICNEIMRIMPQAFHRIPDHFKVQEMHIKVVEADQSNLDNVLDHLKTREICDTVVKDYSSSLQFVLDWFVTREGIYMWHDDYYDDDGNCWVTGDDDDKFFNMQGPESKNKRRVNAYCLAAIKMAELVHVRRREKTNRKIMEVTDSCFKNYLMQNHCLRVYFDLTPSKDFNKMNPLEIMLRLMMVVLEHIKTQEMCIDAVHIEAGSLVYLSDCFKTQEICDEAVAATHTC